MLSKLWIVRHANRLDFVRPEWFQTATYPYDPPLADNGWWQAEAIADRLGSASINYILASPYLRAIQTAVPLAKRLNLPIYPEKGAMEWLPPNWTDGFPALTPPALLTQEYPSVDFGYRSKVVPTYPETEEVLHLRIATMLDAIITEFSGVVVIVTHKEAAMAMVRYLVGDRVPWINPPSVGAIYELSSDDRGIWQMSANADTSHLS